MAHFAEFAKAAGSRVSLQRMYGTPQTAGGLGIAGRFLQLHSFIVQLLHKFCGSLEEQLAEFGHAVIGGAIIARPIAAWAIVAWAIVGGPIVGRPIIGRAIIG
jgi:hypothetical protein